MAILRCLLAVALVFFLASCQDRKIAEQAARLEELGAKNAALEQELESVRRDLAAARAALHEEGGPVTPVETLPAPQVNPDDLPEVQQLKASLVEANASLAALQIQLTRLEAQVAEAANDRERAQRFHAELRAKLEASERAVEAANAELKNRDERLNQLVEMSRTLRQDNEASARRLADFKKLADQLTDLERRREDSAGTIMSRYREVTEQYRALANAIDGQQQVGTGVTRSLDLSRIQQTILSAEDELRQLRSLNAQAQRLQKQLIGKLP